MITSLTHARDEICARSKTIADNLLLAIRPEMVYDDILVSIPRNADSRWARVSVRHDGGSQESLSGPEGSKMWGRTGSVIVQVFTPQNTGMVASNAISQAFRNGFQGYSSPGSIWFRDVRIEEIGNSGAFYQVNVIARFEYTQIQ